MSSCFRTNSTSLRKIKNLLGTNDIFNLLKDDEGVCYFLVKINGEYRVVSNSWLLESRGVDAHFLSPRPNIINISLLEAIQGQVVSNLFNTEESVLKGCTCEDLNFGVDTVRKTVGDTLFKRLLKESGKIFLPEDLTLDAFKSPLFRLKLLSGVLRDVVSISKKHEYIYKGVGYYLVNYAYGGLRYASTLKLLSKIGLNVRPLLTYMEVYNDKENEC